jgi:hypothetical protein
MTVSLSKKQKKYEKRLMAFAYDIKSGQQARRVRERLNSYIKTLPDKDSWVVSVTLYYMKERFGLKNVKLKQHYLTDHAFCRGLERCYGVDINKLKDMLLTDIIQNNKFDFVGNEETVFTIIRSEKL